MLRIPGLSLLCVMIAMMFSFTTIVPVESMAASATKSVVKKASRKKKKSKRSKRSKCSPTARAEGKRQAIDLVRTQSPELCRLAGMDFTSTGEAVADARALIATDGEKTDALTPTAQSLMLDEGEDIAELEREDDVTVDVDGFRSLWLQYVDDNGAEVTEGGIPKQNIIDVVMDWLGTRYDFGGQARTGIDCSAFTRMVYASVAKVELPRTASQQSTIGRTVSKRTELQFGDLIFFHTRRHAYVSHVGVYLGDNLFAHASSRYGVTISSLESTYYSKRLIGARRLTEADITRLASMPDTTAN
ncbi:MAG: C40 family peptidase [Ignavibacteria bacterium]|nr:C40 family peptidase [Ignavibacteria bacterium]MBK7033825.1 C40 family peptidase [Ignavibacteria bacterium]MBK7576240.1 C40 family peptidase [Ignavibacteria bacterium]